MFVCHVIQNTDLGGAEVMLYKLLQHVSPSQAESRVISLMGCGVIGDQVKQLGVPVYALDALRNGFPRPLPLMRLVGLLRQLQPDVVQTWTYHANVLGGLAARLAGNLPVVWNIRHSTLDRRIDSRNTLVSAWLGARLSRWLPTWILLNSQAALQVHKRKGYDGRRMHVVPNGFDAQLFCPSPAARCELRAELGLAPAVSLVGMCGRFHAHKGQREFVAAAARIGNREPDAHFIMAGDGSSWENAELARWITETGMSHRFHLLGRRMDMPRVLGALDVYVLPSLTEGLPNVVGEAMACEVPCVVTDVGDAARLIADTGHVVPPRDPGRLAAAIIEQLARPLSVRRQLGTRARRRIIEHYDLLAVRDRYLEVWCSTCRALPVASRRCPRTAAANIPAHSLYEPAQAGGLPQNKTKLVHVTTIPLTQWLFLRGQNKFMSEHGFDVHCVSSPGRHLDALAARDTVATHAVTISRQINPLRDLVSFFQLWQLFRRLHPEIAQLSTPKAALLGSAAAWCAGVPVRIYQIRGLSSESETGVRRRFYQTLEALTARMCTGFFVNSKSLLAYARHARILREGDGKVVGAGMSNGVDVNRFDLSRAAGRGITSGPRWYGDPEQQLPPDALVIGYVGRVARDKGIEELNEAWQVTRVEFPQARLLLVGPWESENAVTPSCRQTLRRDTRVIIAGLRDDVTPFYRAMDLFVFPSHGSEGFPNAPMEAAAAGLPVIATRVIGSVDAVVDGVTGRIVPPRCSRSLHAAIRTYLQDPRLRQRHGRAGQTRVRTSFASERLWSQFHTEYLSLLSAAGLTTFERVDQPVAGPIASGRRAA